MTDLNSWTREQFLALPRLRADNPIDSLVLVPLGPKARYEWPQRRGHGLIAVVAVQGEAPQGIVAPRSDSLHLDGLFGGRGFAPVPTLWPHAGARVASGWTIDLLATSQLLRLFCRKPLRVGAPHASLEIFADDPSK